ncbi:MULTISPECIES: metallophosphoesterase [Rhodobacterales]|uniref:metallophosphoesterase n=1 Tax=Rhodobacterales TaxID=204455 RepID=UPI001109C40C|nr:MULTISPECIES: metallophosphoesterase [Rhodobacterales]
MLTVIPDLHADPARLSASFAQAGPEIAFLGDFIDGGTGADDAAVLREVRGRIDAGRAIGVMGNHELNAILFHRRGADGQPLRERSQKNIAQHRSFLSAFGTETPEALDWTEWFLRTLPLWHERPGLRLVHAFWSDPLIATIRARRPDGFLQHGDLPEIAAESTEFSRAVKLLVSGPEVRLPGSHGFADIKGNLRRDVRVAWWRAGARSWKELALSVPDPSALPAGDPGANLADILYPGDGPCVLFGHYKMAPPLRIDHDRAACLDYPAAPCLYRWDGEDRLGPEQLLALL